MQCHSVDLYCNDIHTLVSATEDILQVELKRTHPGQYIGELAGNSIQVSDNSDLDKPHYSVDVYGDGRADLARRIYLAVDHHYEADLVDDGGVITEHRDAQKISA